VLLVPAAPDHANHGFARENLMRLAGATDAKGRPLDVLPFGVTASAQAAGEIVDVPT
jgi:hypothetical protein